MTVRAIGRSCRFVPNKQVRDSVEFALKATVAKFEGKIELHEYQFLSNHYHLLGTDVGGLLPKFMCEFNAQVSRQLNALRGIRGSNVEKDYNLCVVDMKTGRRAFEHAVYILTNAVSAHLVERSAQWLGPNSYGLEYGEEEVLGRPGLNDLAVVEEQHPVGDLLREAHLVRHHQHGHAVPGQVRHDAQHVAHQFGV